MTKVKNLIQIRYIYFSRTADSPAASARCNKRIVMNSMKAWIDTSKEWSAADVWSIRWLLGQDQRLQEVLDETKRILAELGVSSSEEKDVTQPKALAQLRQEIVGSTLQSPSRTGRLVGTSWD